MRSMLGAPVVTYRSLEKIPEVVSAGKAWKIFKNGEKNGYVMGATTGGESNHCGLAIGHSFSVLAAFEVGNEKVLMMRTPSGPSGYSGEWNKDDSRWNFVDDL